jgi:hypothetical protein
MVNLICGWRFSETRSPESEGSQQPIQIGQADDVDCRQAKGHRRANRGIKHLGGNDDRYPSFGLNDGYVSARAPFGVQLPDLAAMQRVPTIMDLSVLVDMGRVDPRWLWGRKAWLFTGSDRGGERAASMYSLILTAKLNNVDPRARLADVLGGIGDHPASHLDQLFPRNGESSLPPQLKVPRGIRRMGTIARQLRTFKQAWSFDMQPGPNRWLAEYAFVCVGKRWPDAVHLDTCKVL